MENYRPTVALIQLNHIKHNLEAIQKIIPNKIIIPVVKANAYGHGVLAIVKYLKQLNIKYFAVSLLEEALQLREQFEDISILVMGVIDAQMLQTCSNKNITFTISDPLLGEAVCKSDLPLKCHIKYDTGMHRLGLKSEEETIELVKVLSNKSNINLEGLYTHFATADSDHGYHAYQLDRFRKLLEKIEHKFDMIHASNSSSSLKFENSMLETTHVRLGISLYGLTLEKKVPFLKPALLLKTKIVQIKTLLKGEYLGYGITYQSLEDEKIGILPIGYADGFIRKNQNGYVDINHKKYQIVGRVCMDQTFVKIDDSIKLNDEVIMMGSAVVSIDDVADRLETINYEVVCNITNRVPRIYLDKEKIYEI